MLTEQQINDKIRADPEYWKTKKRIAKIAGWLKTYYQYRAEWEYLI